MRGVKESDDTIHPTKIKMLSCPRSTPLYVRHQPQAQKAYVVRSPSSDGFDGTLSSYTCASYVTSISHFT